jgi:hypothetical protein
MDNKHFPPRAMSMERNFPQQQMTDGPNYGDLENEIDKLWAKMRATDSEMRKILDAEKKGKTVKEDFLKVELKYIKQNLQMIELARARSKAYDDWKGKIETHFMAPLSLSAVISFFISGHGAEKEKEEGRGRGK